jgi:hypothetical protein
MLTTMFAAGTWAKGFPLTRSRVRLQRDEMKLPSTRSGVPGAVETPR